MCALFVFSYIQRRSIVEKKKEKKIAHKLQCQRRQKDGCVVCFFFSLIGSDIVVASQADYIHNPSNMTQFVSTVAGRVTSIRPKAFQYEPYFDGANIKNCSYNYFIIWINLMGSIFLFFFCRSNWTIWNRSCSTISFAKNASTMIVPWFLCTCLESRNSYSKIITRGTGSRENRCSIVRNAYQTRATWMNKRRPPHQWSACIVRHWRRRRIYSTGKRAPTDFSLLYACRIKTFAGVRNLLFIDNLPHHLLLLSFLHSTSTTTLTASVWPYIHHHCIFCWHV